MKSYALKLRKICGRIASKNYFSFPYALGRSILALSLLVTIGCSDKYVLFPEHLYTHPDIVYYLKEFNLFFLFGYDGLWISRLIACFLMVFVISGYYPRASGILHWWVSLSFIHSSMLIDGGDQIVAVMTFLLVPITLLDNRVNHWQGAVTSGYKNFAAFCTFCLIELQVAVVYLQAGIEKPYRSEEWTDGTAFYYWINHNVFGTSDLVKSILNPLLSYGSIVTLFTWGTIIFEVSLFGLIFMSRKRRAGLLKFALLFHFLIIIFHGLVSFFFAMAGALILYLVPKEFNKKQFLCLIGWKQRKSITTTAADDNNGHFELEENFPIPDTRVLL